MYNFPRYIKNYFYLVLEQRPIQNDNKEEALYAREVFTKLLRDVVLRDMVDQEIETPKKSEVKNHIKPTVQPNVQFLEYKDGFDEANNMKFRDENAVEVVCNVVLSFRFFS